MRLKTPTHTFNFEGIPFYFKSAYTFLKLELIEPIIG